jgi:hypothetical protein
LRLQVGDGDFNPSLHTAMNIALKLCAEEQMNLFPEVAWDRYTESENGLTLYGWIGREDSHEDFMVILIKLAGRSLHIRFITSSARYSKEFSRRSGGTHHIPCKRIEGVFNVRTTVSQLSTLPQ